MVDKQQGAKMLEPTCARIKTEEIYLLYIYFNVKSEDPRKIK